MELSTLLPTNQRYLTQGLVGERLKMFADSTIIVCVSLPDALFPCCSVPPPPLKGSRCLLGLSLTSWSCIEVSASNHNRACRMER